MKFRTRYDRLQVGIDCSAQPGDVATVQQNAKDECDVNKIMARYIKTGQLPGMIQKDGRYGDFSEVGSYQEALNLVIKADEQFAALPSSVRKRFNHNPEEMLAFVENPENASELKAMGLTKEMVQPEPKEAVKAVKTQNKSPETKVEDNAKA